MGDDKSPITGQRVLVTGASGQDGFYLLDDLRSRGADVMSVARNTAMLRDNLKTQVDITNASAVNKLIKTFKPNKIFHLAASHYSSETSYSSITHHVSESISVHVTATNNLLAAMTEHSPESRLFFASSSRVFGEPTETPQNETTPRDPRCAYGISKLAGMGLCRLYREAHGIFASSGILYHHDSAKRPGHFLIPRLVKDALKIKHGSLSRLQVGDPEAIVDIGYAPEFVDAMQRIIELPHSDDFVISTDSGVYVRDVIKCVFDVVGIPPDTPIDTNQKILKHRPTNLSLIGNSSKLRAATGWKPTAGIYDIIQSVFAEVSK